MKRLKRVPGFVIGVVAIVVQQTILVLTCNYHRYWVPITIIGCISAFAIWLPVSNLWDLWRTQEVKL